MDRSSLWLDVGRCGAWVSGALQEGVPTSASWGWETGTFPFSKGPSKTGSLRGGIKWWLAIQFMVCSLCPVKGNRHPTVATSLAQGLLHLPCVLSASWSWGALLPRRSRGWIDGTWAAPCQKAPEPVQSSPRALEEKREAWVLFQACCLLGGAGRLPEALAVVRR